MNKQLLNPKLRKTEKQKFCQLIVMMLLQNKKDKKAPEANGVVKSELPAGVLPKEGAAPPNKEGVAAEPNKDGVEVEPNKEGVEEDPNKDDDELKSDVCGEAPEVPKREGTGAEVVGVVNKDDVVVADGAEDEVPKSENPLPDEVEQMSIMVQSVHQL